MIDSIERRPEKPWEACRLRLADNYNQFCNCLLFSARPAPPCILAVASPLKHLKTRTDDTSRTRETRELGEQVEGHEMEWWENTTSLVSVSQSPAWFPNHSEAKGQVPCALYIH